MRRATRLVLPWVVLAAVAAPQFAAQPLQPVRLLQAAVEVPEDELLDVGIQVFDAGTSDATPEQLDKAGIFEEVRQSEGIFVPVQLKRTLESTGYWGAVRVISAPTDAVDLIVTGELIESTGKRLAFSARATDATGKVWFEKRYKQEADPKAYALTIGTSSASAGGGEGDPYQYLYNHLANDLLARRNKLDPDKLRTVRQVARLRFAADLAPDAFGDYLTVDKKGHRKIARLPAAGDPILERVDRIRERDYQLVDTLNEYYATFVAQMSEPYGSWRSYSYDELLAFEKLRRKARMRKFLGALAIFGAIATDGGGDLSGVARDVALIGGIEAIRSGIGKSQEAKIHREALKELGASFGSEVEPLRIDVEGQTLRLSGTAETQYTTWRSLLRGVWAHETGVPIDPNDGPDLSISEAEPPAAADPSGAVSPADRPVAGPSDLEPQSVEPSSVETPFVELGPPSPTTELPTTEPPTTRAPTSTPPVTEEETAADDSV